MTDPLTIEDWLQLLQEAAGDRGAAVQLLAELDRPEDDGDIGIILAMITAVRMHQAAQ